MFSFGYIDTGMYAKYPTNVANSWICGLYSQLKFFQVTLISGRQSYKIYFRSEYIPSLKEAVPELSIKNDNIYRCYMGEKAPIKETDKKEETLGKAQ